MSTTDLQAVLDLSLARASDFTKSLFAGNSWSAEEVEAFANKTGNITVATVSPSGRPLATTAIAAMVDGVLYFTGSPKSATVRNIEREPHIALSITDSAHGVVGRGVAKRTGRAPELESLLASLAEARGARRFVPPGWDGYIYTVELDSMFAN